MSLVSCTYSNVDVLCQWKGMRKTHYLTASKATWRKQCVALFGDCNMAVRVRCTRWIHGWSECLVLVTVKWMYDPSPSPFPSSLSWLCALESLNASDQFKQTNNSGGKIWGIQTDTSTLGKTVQMRADWKMACFVLRWLHLCDLWFMLSCQVCFHLVMLTSFQSCLVFPVAGFYLLWVWRYPSVRLLSYLNGTGVVLVGKNHRAKKKEETEEICRQD